MAAPLPKWGGISGTDDHDDGKSAGDKDDEAENKCYTLKRLRGHGGLARKYIDNV